MGRCFSKHENGPLKRLALPGGIELVPESHGVELGLPAETGCQWAGWGGRGAAGESVEGPSVRDHCAGSALL